MHTPGATISTRLPKLLNAARVSSRSSRHVYEARPPGSPSKSASAETVITSGWLAGLKSAASTESLPAAAA